MDLVLSESLESVINFKTTLAAQRTSAGFECAKFGMTLVIFSSLNPVGILSARKSRI